MGRGGYRQINKALNICAFEDYLSSQAATVPPLPDVAQLTPRVLRILGQNPGKFTLQGTNTYIVGTGRTRLIIDTGQGIPEWADLIASTFSSLGITLSHVLLTHWHGDHTGGVPDLIRLYPHLEGHVYKHTPDRKTQQQPIEDGQVFRVEGATVRAVHAPGHSHDHMCFVLEEENAMFTGDNILGHGTAAVEILPTWMASLRVMQGHGCQAGYPAHGEVVADLGRKITLELDVKERRERKVLATLARLRREAAVHGGKGSVTVAELVTQMYGDTLDEVVREKAIEPFTDEILRKLTGDGKVAFEVKGGKRRWFALQLV
ncbi:beta-lactamase-like protein [Echria macrotheca]|uniref:Beta-lactamase-like protein n=1 Tax=Echria macrotheca TaxID=438768 RepID=A0AAJ0B8J6_9PEZI|nr:beta-lactamase-like protein [Echria macrotheca]